MKAVAYFILLLMRRILMMLLLATSLLGQTNVSVFKIDTERTLLNKAADVAPKIVQRHTYYVADDGRQRHEIQGFKRC